MERRHQCELFPFTHGRALLSALLIASLSGCGGGTPTLGTPTSPSPAVLQTYTISVASAETGRPVSHARISLDGASLETNDLGQVQHSGTLTSRTFIDIDGTGFILRQAVFGSGPQFFLWPRTAASGMDEVFLKWLVYRVNLMFRHANGAEVAVLPSDEIQSDGAAMATIRAAAMSVGEVTRGRVTYTVVNQRPSTGYVIEVLIDSSGGLASANVKHNANCESVGGSVKVHAITNARALNIVLHELGHHLGLNDIYPASGAVVPGYEQDLMGSGSGVTGFSERERFALQLMYEYRRQGNRFPDQDRERPILDGGNACWFYDNENR